MDQIRIGQFIALERKAKGYTQRQLAERLGISDKTVSKWERGGGFPEVSLLLPLCTELEISVNELLSAQRLSEQDYRKKAEENMENMIREREENRKHFVNTVITGVIATVAFVTLLLVVCLYTETIPTAGKVILITVACVIFAAGLYVAMAGEREIGYYQCKRCGHYFIPTWKAYIMGPHMLTTRRLKCPQCGQRSYCKKVMGKD